MKMSSDLVQVTDKGLYCAEGDFFIDPWKPVHRALITHAHSDHGRPGHQNYMATRQTEPILRMRVGEEACIQTVEYGQKILLNEVKIQFFPAGHILGSAQIRLEYQGEVWCVSGDYKTSSDQTCESYQPVHCHTFITESTFGLPIFRWPAQERVFDEINQWWRRNQTRDRVSILFCYSLGKAQRVLAGIDPNIGPILTHGAIEKVNLQYRQQKISLPDTVYAPLWKDKKSLRQALVIAPPSANGTPWLRRFGRTSTGFVSGWMKIRGFKRRRSVDRGFVLSDHVDWPQLMAAIEATGAERVMVTHGYEEPVVRILREKGVRSEKVRTEFDNQDEGPE